MRSRIADKIRMHYFSLFWYKKNQFPGIQEYNRFINSQHPTYGVVYFIFIFKQNEKKSLPCTPYDTLKAQVFFSFFNNTKKSEKPKLIIRNYFHILCLKRKRKLWLRWQRYNLQIEITGNLNKSLNQSERKIGWKSY